MKILNALILAFFLCFPFAVHAQSGRNRNLPKPPTDTPQPTKTSDSDSGIVNESKITPGGETVEGNVIRTDTALVMVPVTVVDRNGRYVPQLRREDFRLMENGVDQKIAYFATTDSPFTVVLVIDTSGSTHFKLEEIQDAAMDFVSKLKDNDSVMVMSFDDRISVECRATTDREEIRHAIKRTRTGGGTRLYDAVEQIFKKELNTIAGRKAVVLFTDGLYEVEGADGDEYGQARLLAAVRRRINLPVVQLFDELLADVRQYAVNRDFLDDVCIVGMEVSRAALAEAARRTEN